MAYKYLNDDGLKAYTKKVKGALKNLHTPIAISSENTTESKAQNVKNMADFVAKAKAAGIADVNGMAVSCIIDGDYSGVGYIYTDSLCGIEIFDDFSNPMNFTVNIDGTYGEVSILMENSSDIITSNMLTQGARRPIILTPSTTEVDEETYQKLLSEDVDVIFKADDSILTNILIPTYKEAAGVYYFTALSVEGESLADVWLYGYKVSINDTAPHNVTIEELCANDVFTILEDNGFINQGILSSVLQEIDLTGNDAERKAKLDQFEADWKALTGADDLTGARFVGSIAVNQRIFKCLLSFNSARDFYSGIAVISDNSYEYLSIFVNTNGYLEITKLFSHLEPLTIKTGGAAADIAVNKAAISAYKQNLARLGITTANGYQASVVVTSNGEGYTGTLNIGKGPLLMGIVTDVNETHHYPFHIEVATGKVTFDKTNYFLEKTSNEVTEMLDAIKYSYTPVPLTDTTSTNKTQLDLFLSKVPNAQVMHCTYKDMYAGTLHKINGSWYGVLVGESNTLAGQLSIKLQADGTIVEGAA